MFIILKCGIYFLELLLGPEGPDKPESPNQTTAAVKHGNKLTSTDFFHVIIVSTPGGNTVCNGLTHRHREHPELKGVLVKLCQGKKKKS